MCQCCRRASEMEFYPHFSIGCKFCGARILWLIGILAEPTLQEDRPTAIKRRRLENLADWVAFGHDEAEIRALYVAKNWTCPATTTAKKQIHKQPK